MIKLAVKRDDILTPLQLKAEAMPLEDKAWCYGMAFIELG